eukprot:gene1768-3428_t
MSHAKKNHHNASPYLSSMLDQSRPNGHDDAHGDPIVLRDFQNSIKHRKRLTNQIRQASTDDNTPVSTLKRLLLEIRQLTLSIVEDVLEIEYKSQLKGNKSTSQKNLAKLPPIASFEALTDPNDLASLAEMITDIDDIPKLPNIRQFLPADFPTSRNPFILGKTVEELASLDISPPEAGNLDNEIKMMELLRYKRAAAALLRVERQTENRMPLTIKDVERLWYRMHDDFSVNLLIRAICTIAENTMNETVERGTELHHFTDTALMIDPESFLEILNQYENKYPLRIEIQASIRRYLYDCSLNRLKDHSCSFLVEWLRVILGHDCILDEVAHNNSGHKIKFERNSSTHTNNTNSNGSSNGNTNANSNTDDDQSYSSNSIEKRSVGSSLGPITKRKKNLKIKTSSSFHSIIKDNSSINSNNKSNSNDKNKNEREDLSSMRYELLKLQQELLRRGVLDPRHYHAAIIISTKAISWGNSNNNNSNTAMNEGIVELIYEPLRDIVIGRLSRIHNSHTISKRQNFSIGERETVFSMRFSKLIVDRLTGHTIESILEKKDTVRVSALSHIYEQIKLALDAMKSTSTDLEEINDMDNILVPEVDRIVYKCTMSAGEVAVEVVISRNLECNGIHLTCTPLTNIQSGQTMKYLSPVTVSLLDEELQVLLINQRSLYNLAMGKWSSLGVVCQWLVSRLLIRRVPVYGKQQQQLSDGQYDTTIGAGGVTTKLVPVKDTTITTDHRLHHLSSGGSLAARSIGDLSNNSSSTSLFSKSMSTSMSASVPIPTPSVVSRGSTPLTPAPAPTPSPSSSLSPSNKKRRRIRTPGTGTFIDYTGGDDNNESMIGTGTSGSNTAFGSNESVLLDVSLDRVIEISEDAQIQWKSRNIPNIIGSTCHIDAHQESEFLLFDIAISFPRCPPRTRKRADTDDIPIDEYGDNIKNNTSSAAANSDKDETASEDDEYDDYYKSNSKNNLNDLITINLSYKLSNIELLIFGSAGMIDEPRISLTTGGRGRHPAGFMWNILTRLQIIFKGSKANPYSKMCNAIDPDNWSITYERKLLRDIRTISGGVMTVTASAVGTELVYDSKPTEGSIYKAVGSKLIMASEIKELVLAEGWPLHVLDWGKRPEIASRILDKMKVIEERSIHRLELYTFAESRILFVGLMSGSGTGRDDFPLGSVEINEHMTLSDVRVIIANELDRDLVPRAYRFMYKGNPCATRQESFRKAWETLPRVTILARKPRQGELISDEKKEDKDNILAERMKFLKSQRRIAKGLIPVPIFTLCRVQEESTHVFAYHDISDMIRPGDVLRFGHVKARDYIVPMPIEGEDNNNSTNDNTNNNNGNSKGFGNGDSMGDDENKPVRTFMIEPAFDMVNEDEAPFQGNFPLMTFEKMPHITALPDMKKKSLSPRASIMSSTSATTDGMEKHMIEDEKNDNEGMKSFSINFENASEIPFPTTSTSTSIDAKPTAIVKEIPDMKPNRTVVGNFWTDIWIWKCIPRSEDTRPKWKQLYDDGSIPYQFTYQTRDDGPSYFRINLLWKNLELLCRDSRCPDLSIYCQRVNEMALLSVDYYTDLAFTQMCNWYPQFSEFIDNNKFLKLLRDTKVFPDMKKPQRQGQLEQLFQKEVKTFGLADRYATYAGFCRVLQQVALIRFPHGQRNIFGDDPNHNRNNKSPKRRRSKTGEDNASAINDVQSKKKSSTYYRGKFRDKSPPRHVDPGYQVYVFNKLVTDYLMLVPEWADRIWEEAKLSAMNKEAKKQAAATRIISRWRGSYRHYLYNWYRRCLIKFQAHIRRRQTYVKIQRIFSNTVEDWLFRLRYYSTSLIQSCVRRFIVRCRHLRIMKTMRDQQLFISNVRRERLKVIHSKMRKSILYKQIRCVSGVMTVLRVQRKDQRSYSKDYGIIIDVYIPRHAETFHFVIEEETLREYMEEVLKKTGLSPSELFEEKNMERMIASRLLCRASRRPGKPPKVMFSQQALGQKGNKVMTHGRLIANDEFICTLFERTSDITVQCYHRYTCRIFECSLITSAMRTWVQSEHNYINKIPNHKYECSPLLKPENKKDLYLWIISNIVVDKRHKEYKVMFGCQYQRSRKLEFILRIQSIWRKSLTRHKLLKHLATYIFLVKSAEDEGYYYYLNTKTGDSTWEKPAILLNKELPEEPTHQWVRLWYITDREMYVNPYSGRYSHLGVTTAGRMIVSVARNHLMKPFNITPQQYTKAKYFERNIQKEYEKNPTKLGNIVNFALLSHVVHQNDVRAKQLFLDALKLADASPLLTRAYAIYLLSTCEAPVLSNKEKALSLLRDANRRDPSLLKFVTALNSFYKYACLKDPENIKSLLNLGLAYYYVCSNIGFAEKLLRRALVLAPFDDRVTQNWSYVKDMFPVRNGQYLSPTIVIRSARKKSVTDTSRRNSGAVATPVVTTTTAAAAALTQLAEEDEPKKSVVKLAQQQQATELLVDNHSGKALAKFKRAAHLGAFLSMNLNEHKPPPDHPF